ncbi:TetR/AcrR family transcriptional regulator [Verrucomicrobium sp. BvORR106]|uniref:TetR/AcrR family transcriptional regulator n=1 Tax=Verrucomicrobium sp. BvORR106 TaxID=1403819 RepID=UPI00068AEA01|nr:TetR/AcrR family transcriptional regulator [Verrucomicrobium sp. BvORR106]
MISQPSKRLSSDERREAIIRAALKVFSERGFHGSTTKALALEAGVSEALIFRHFPSKDELYTAMQMECCRAKHTPAAEEMMALEPSTSSLVTMVHYFMAKMLRPPQRRSQEENSLYRLMLHSFSEDGEFARGFMRHVGDGMINQLKACIDAAGQAGDLSDTPVGTPALRAWLAQHLAGMLMLNELPGRPVVDMGVSYAELVEQSTWFALRGIGVRDEAIKRHYNPKAFAMLMGSEG